MISKIIITYKIIKRFYKSVGYFPNLYAPKSFNEKIQWLKLNYKDNLLTKCTDKYLVRKYIAKKIGTKYLVKLISFYKSVEEIDFSKLPNKFVLKTNWGSGQNLICKNKKNISENEYIEKLKKWLRPESNHYYFSYEWSYKNIKPKILCETLLENRSGEEIIDYKFLCFNGDPKLMFVCSERFSKKMKVSFYDMDFKLLPFKRLYPKTNKKIKKPKNFQKMISLSKILSKPFPFVRVDFYEVNNKLYVGELTFYPGNGMEPFEPKEWDYKLGNLLKLPKKN